MRWLLFIILLSVGWTWEGHTALVGAVYSSFPPPLQANLSLAFLDEGAIAPDKIFRDVTRHHYPYSLVQAERWLGEASASLAEGNYSAASYSFGVAAHYISDSFAAPHNMIGESSKDHTSFERQALRRPLQSPCQSGPFNLSEALQDATHTSEDWPLWLDTRNPDIPHQEFEDSLALLYRVAHATFNTTCRKEDVRYHSLPFWVSAKVLFYFLLLLVFFLIAVRFV